jgi:predicted RNase H-like HicB family nuclease
MVEKLPNGYWAMCPTISNCFANGLSYEEVLVNVRAAIEKELKKVEESGGEIRRADAFSFTVMEVRE